MILIQNILRIYFLIRITKGYAFKLVNRSYIVFVNVVFRVYLNRKYTTFLNNIRPIYKFE